MGRIKELNDVVDKALSLIKENKKLSWLEAIDQAKEIVLKDKDKTDIDNGEIYLIKTGETIAEI
ncbi:hypothetical protein [uncultured Clostridium sp.]|uniref:hypothetical protein n=1 Tax=uncultured Clostridium sp. TaxID=59620 RepID=UPI0025D29D18|nr:hypothetical protein [uncultured Clostridium sp.]